jgi:hypothetical protein
MTHNWLTNWFLYSNHNLFLEILHACGCDVSSSSLWAEPFESSPSFSQHGHIIGCWNWQSGRHNEWESALEILETGSQAQWEVTLEILETDMQKAWGIHRSPKDPAQWCEVGQSGDSCSPHNPRTWHSGGSLTGLLIRPLKRLPQEGESYQRGCGAPGSPRQCCIQEEVTILLRLATRVKN